MVSLPAPPSMESLPDPPTSESSPSPPLMEIVTSCADDRVVTRSTQKYCALGRQHGDGVIPSAGIEADALHLCRSEIEPIISMLNEQPFSAGAGADGEIFCVGLALNNQS